MGEEIILNALKERLVKNVSDFKATQILFHARFEVPFGHKSKKNGKQPFVITPKNGRRPYATLPTRPDIKQAENFYLLKLREAANKMSFNFPIRSDVQLWLVAHFHFKNYYVKKKRRMSMRLNDLSNLYELPQDALQKAGIIEDDVQICSHDLSRRLPGNKDEIEIFLIEYSASV